MNILSYMRVYYLHFCYYSEGCIAHLKMFKSINKCMHTYNLLTRWEMNIYKSLLRSCLAVSGDSIAVLHVVRHHNVIKNAA